MNKKGDSDLFTFFINIIIIFVIGMLIGSAISLNREMNKVCKNYEFKEGSIWKEYYSCYNASIVNSTFTKYGEMDFIRGGVQK